MDNITDDITQSISINNWDDMGLKTELLRGVYNYGFENPSNIQKQAILPIIQGRDIIAQSQSGCGKTGAFTIGILQRIDVSIHKTQAMIIAPTHELVTQIALVVKSIGECMEGLVVKTVVGGTSIVSDAEEMKKTVPHIIVGSAGRIYDKNRRKHINARNIKIFALDEADEMLSRGFKEQIYNIFQSFNEDVQAVLFSATVPDEMIKVTQKFMRDPLRIEVKREKLNLECIQQYFVALPDDRAKFETLKTIFGSLTVNQCIIYVNSVGRVVELCEAMNKEGFSVCCIHSSMKREEREKVFYEFRKGIHRVLISSNVTARGIDIQQVSTVINFDLSKCVHTYLHRIGRSGRWGRKGLAINFITRKDIDIIKNIERHYSSNIKELPSDFRFDI
jgi:translation initiation factor 4A